MSIPLSHLARFFYELDEYGQVTLPTPGEGNCRGWQIVDVDWSDPEAVLVTFLIPGPSPAYKDDAS